MAGGTNLLTLIGADVYLPLRLVNIKLVNIKKVMQGMSSIELDNSGGLCIGALTTLAALETSELIQQQYPVPAEAAVAATPQPVDGENRCATIFDQDPCWAVHP